MTASAPTSAGLRFAGIGTALPANVVTNDKLSEQMDTSDEWIRERTGIGSRRLGSTTSELAIAAARAAIEQSGIDQATISQVILATTTPDYIMPGTAPAVAHALGLECGAFDVQAVCSGWVYGMVVANGMLLQGLDNVLLIGADAMEQITDYTDRGTGILFGNGAGAAILQRNPSASGELLGWDLGSNGKHVHILYSEHGKTMSMDGKEVFRQAVTVMQRSTRAALDMAGLDIDDVDFVIPHQANVRIVEAAWKRLGFSMDQTGLVLDHTGNTSSASIPLALGEAVADGRITDGKIVLFLGFGAGMTWGANVLRWHGPSDPATTQHIEVPVAGDTAKITGAAPAS
ncbi:MAG: beta-ketoacyl-ACP synthase III [Acidimicrobiales bacterium]